MVPGGSVRSRTTANADPIATAIERDHHRLDHHAGEQGARLRADGLEDAVETDAFDGEEREEECHHDDRDGQRHADDLVEHRPLLSHAADRVCRLGLRHRLRRVPRRLVDAVRDGRRIAGRPDDEGLEHARADRAAGPVGVLHVAPRRRRRPQRPGSRVARIVDEAQDLHGCACRAEPERVAPFDALVPKDAVGIGRAAPRRRRQAAGRELVADQRDVDEVAGTVAGDPCSELGHADATGALHAWHRLDPGAQLRGDPAAQERLLRRGREHDQVRPLGADRAGGAGDQPVEQSTEQHEQHRDQRQQRRRDGETPGAAPHLT